MLGQLRNKCLDDRLHGWGEEELDTFLEEDGDVAKAFGAVRQKISVVTKTPKNRTNFLEIGGHGHVSEGGNIGGVRVNASRGNGMAKKTSVCRTNLYL